MVLTPASQQQRGRFPTSPDVEEEDDIHEELDGLHQHDEEGSQPEIVEQGGYYGAHRLVEK